MTNAFLELRKLHKRFGEAVPADGFFMSVEKGEFFTMLGPSGSGKSTILRMIAGLEYPDRGEIVIGGRDVTHTPPWGRNLGMVFQNYAIFPHLNVSQNIAYGLRTSALSKAETTQRVEELLALVGLSGFGRRNVNQLSGGEQQRVAIARALAPNPSVLLLDEPLSALDEKIRREMQDELKAIHTQTGTTFVYVTHDQEEAMTMSDRVAVLNAGKYVQCDTPEEIFQHPRTPFVAKFFRGCNVLRAKLTQTPEGVRVGLAGGEITVGSNRSDLRSGQVAVRSEVVVLDGPCGSDALTLPATVEKVTYRGVYTSYLLRLHDGQYLSVSRSRHCALQPGDTAALSIQPVDLVILEPDRHSAEGFPGSET